MTPRPIEEPTDETCMCCAEFFEPGEDEEYCDECFYELEEKELI